MTGAPVPGLSSPHIYSNHVHPPPRPRYRLPLGQRGPGAGRRGGGRAVGRAGALLHPAAGDGAGGAGGGGDRRRGSRRHRHAARAGELHRPADRPRHDARPVPGAGDPGDGPPLPAGPRDVTALDLPPVPPIVRPAGEADLDAIAGLEQAAFHDPWPREMLAYELCHPHSVLLVAAGAPEAPPAAYAAFRHATGEAELLRVAVDPESLRRGLAPALRLEGLERLRDARVDAGCVEV